jgi:hypothetical protein
MKSGPVQPPGRVVNRPVGVYAGRFHIYAQSRADAWLFLANDLRFSRAARTST